MLGRSYRYCYIKKTPSKPVGAVLSENKTSIASSVLMFIGAGIIAWVVWPILSFKFIEAPKFAKLLEPVPEPKVKKVLAAGSKTLGVEEKKRLAFYDKDNTSVDYSKASNWFPEFPQKKTENEGNSYKISIPGLGIKNAAALVGGEDLSESLIHYGGTALPGEYGNAVVFGHSTLPYFFDPENYSSIFSTLPKMKKGDEVFVDYDGLRYRYVVEEMFVVKPRDIKILEQRFDDSYLTLVTCVPPGTYLERLVVKARLQKI